MGDEINGQLGEREDAPVFRGGLDQYSCSEQYGQNLGVFGRPLMF